MPTPRSVAAVIPAKDEADRIADTVRAVTALPGVELVIVVDDGSSDATGDLARAAGARVERHTGNQGKAAAMTTGAAAVAATPGGGDFALLFVDADLGASAAGLAPLLAPVLAGEADMTIANIPRANSSKGGGRVVRLAQRTVEARTGRRIAQPLNGMRCLTRQAYDAALPLASGWGVEVGLLLDVLTAGYRVVEVPVEFTHRASGRDWRGVVHRGRQMRDVARVVAGGRGR